MSIRKTLRRAAALLSVLPLAGCGIFSSSDPHEPNELTDFTPRVAVRTVWSTNVGEAVSKNLIPAVTDNAVYAAGDNEVVRIDRQTGDVVWRAEADGSITAGVGTDGNYIAVGTDRGEVQVFDAEGKPIWKARLTADIAVPPLVGAGRVVVKTTDTRITGFDLITGARVWHYQSQAPALSLQEFSQMAWARPGFSSVRPTAAFLRSILKKARSYSMPSSDRPRALRKSSA